jgi:hypothetical protein
METTSGELFRIVEYNFRRDALSGCRVMGSGMLGCFFVWKKRHVDNFPEKDSTITGTEFERFDEIDL